MVVSDPPPRFEAGLFREYLMEMSVDHEFTHVATPQENCYIESFHSIVESAVCVKYEFAIAMVTSSFLEEDERKAAMYRDVLYAYLIKPIEARIIKEVVESL